MTISTKFSAIAAKASQRITGWMALCLLIFSVLVSNQANAQFGISGTGVNYTQDFNSLTTAGTWTNNSTLTGWYARTDNTASIATFGLNTGSTTAAGLYSYGVAGTNPLAERALGYAASNAFTGASGTGKAYIGWRLVNNTGSAISAITVTWTGEQWRRESNTAVQSLILTYQQGATVTALTGGTWTSASSSFASPQTAATALTLDGNAPANKSAGIVATITVNIPAGEEIMIRWEDLNDAGNDHQMAIDDVTINATPSAAPPTVTTTTASSPSVNGFSSGGDVTADGGATVTARGVAYGTSPNPTTSGTVTSDGSGLGVFSSTIGGLSVNTQYYYRAYATNIGGPGYGSESSIFTLANTPNAPSVGSATATSLTVSVAGGDGNPGGTEYAIRESISGNYVQADGTLAGSEVWQTAATWTNTVVSPLANSTLYTFDVKARNGDGVQTGFGGSTNGNTTAAGAQNQTITFNALANKTYGDANFQLTATASSGLTVSYQSSNTNVATIAGDIVTIVGAGSTTITALQAGDGVNWNPAPNVDQSLTVDPKELTVTGAVAQDKVYDGGTVAVITGGTLNGIVGMDDVSLTGGGNFVDPNANTGITVNANFGLTGADASNYFLTQPTGLSADIDQATQTITFNALPVKNTSSPQFNLTATASSGLPVSYNSSNTLVATIGGNIVTIVGGGSTTITASQTGNANYLPATPVNQVQLVLSAVVYSFGVSPTPIATPTLGTPVTNLAVSALSRGNNNGTTTLLTTTSGSSPYLGYNAGAAAFAAPLNNATSTYFDFTLTPAVANSVTLSGISFGSRSTGTGPQAYTLRSSLDGYTSDIATGTLTNTSAWVGRSNTFTSASGNGVAVTYRLYGHSGSGTPSIGTANWRIDSLVLTLAVEAAPDCAGEPVAGTVSGGSSICTGTGTNLTLTGNTDINSASGLSIQWHSSTDNIIFAPTGVGNETTLATGNLTQTTYYYAVVTCSVSGLADTSNTETVTVIPNVNAGTITGPSAMCVSTSILFTSNGDAGGTWNSSNPLVASVDGLGNVSALTPGTTTISYSILSGCGAPSVASVGLSVAQNTAPVVTGERNVCPYVGNGTPVTYTASTPGATVYNWTVPPNVSIQSGQGTANLTVTFGAPFATQANKQIRVTASSACGTSAITVYYLSVQFPGTPRPIVASTNDVCPSLDTNVPITYTIPKVQGASSYIWTAQAGTTTINHPNGLGANDTTVTVTFTSGFSTSAITVQAINDCGASGIRSLSIARINPGTPSLIAGPVNVCEFIDPSATAATYTVALQPAITTYTWNLPGGALSVNGQGTNSISFIYPAGYTGGSISVTASNGCGTSVVPRSLTVTTLNPATPGAIDVINTQLCPTRQYTYSLSSLPSNATSINWTVPVGATLASGQGTTSITVDYPATAVAGAVTAQAVNNCGVSVIRSVDVKLPICPEEFARGNSSVKGAGHGTTSADDLNVQVFPNPSVSDFKVQVNASSLKQVTVRVLDLQGRQLKQMIMMPGALKSFGSDLKPGTYMVEVLQGCQRSMQKLIKL